MKTLFIILNNKLQHYSLQKAQYAPKSKNKEAELKKSKALESLRIAQEEGRYKLDFILDAFNRIQQLKGGKL